MNLQAGSLSLYECFEERTWNLIWQAKAESSVDDLLEELQALKKSFQGQSKNFVLMVASYDERSLRVAQFCLTNLMGRAPICVVCALSGAQIFKELLIAFDSNEPVLLKNLKQFDTGMEVYETLQYQLQLRSDAHFTWDVENNYSHPREKLEHEIIVQEFTKLKDLVNEFFRKTSLCEVQNDINYSIGTSIFNTPLNYLQKWLEGVLALSPLPFEVLIVDDASDQETQKNIQELNRKLTEKTIRSRVLRLDNNMGAAHARNVLLQNITSPYFLLIDSDVVIRKETLARFEEAATINPDAAYICCGYEMISLEMESQTRNKYLPKGLHLPVSLIINTLGDTNALYKTDHIKSLGGWDAADRSRFIDWALALLLLKNNHKILCVPFVGFDYYLRKDSLTARLPAYEAYLKLMNTAALFSRAASQLVMVDRILMLRQDRALVACARKLERFLSRNPFLMKLAVAVKRIFLGPWRM